MTPIKPRANALLTKPKEMVNLWKIYLLPPITANRYPAISLRYYIHQPAGHVNDTLRFFAGQNLFDPIILD